MQNIPPSPHQNMGSQDYSCSSTPFIFPSSSSSSNFSAIMHQHQQPSSWTLPQPFHHHHNDRFNQVVLPYPTQDHDPFLLPLPPPPPPPPPPLASSSPSSHEGLFKSVVGDLQFAYDQGSTASRSTHDRGQLRLQVVQPGSDPFGLQTETSKITAREMMDAKAAAASKSHSEAERRRRERINNHLTKLRSLLPSTTKTDKASLLAEVIQHVKELKRQTSVIALQTPVPTEMDELTIDNASDEEGRVVIRASLCCEDRSDLLQDLIRTLKLLRLRTLKAEMTTLGRRVKNVLFITEEEEDYTNSNNDQKMGSYSINVIEEALQAVIDKTNGDESSSGNVKRQRTNNANRSF